LRDRADVKAAGARIPRAASRRLRADSGAGTGLDPLAIPGTPRPVKTHPERLARPTGFEFPDAIPALKLIPIRGAGAWRALVERPA
jgi:hypothetical protein